MSSYQTILVAVDLDPEADKKAIQRAKAIAAGSNAALFVVHAVESLNAYGAAYAYPTLSDVESEISAEHKKQLYNEAAALSIPQDKLLLETGTPYVVITQKAAELKADLIVVGGHTRHGISLLLGSTTDSVLHNAPCDLLVVHLDQK